MQKRLFFKIDYVCKIPMWGEGSCLADSLNQRDIYILCRYVFATLNILHCIQRHTSESVFTEHCSAQCSSYIYLMFTVCSTTTVSFISFFLIAVPPYVRNCSVLPCFTLSSRSADSVTLLSSGPLSVPPAPAA